MIALVSHAATVVGERQVLPTLLHDRMLTNAPDSLRELVWPPQFPLEYPRLRHPLQKRGLPRVLEGHQDLVTSVAVLLHDRVVSGSYDKTLRVWDLDSGTSVATLEGHLARVGHRLRHERRPSRSPHAAAHFETTTNLRSLSNSCS